MRPAQPTPAATYVVAGLLVALVVLGLVIRVQDPLSGPLAAEDPYTHVVFTKEALERGWFGDSVYLGTGLYPPGIHAFSGVVSSLSGVELYDLAVWTPVVLGLLAVLGTFALADRLAGPVAGLTAALLTAVMPEHVFRTNLFAPTAFDLALVPAWLLLFHLALVPRDGETPHLPLHRSATRLAAGIGFLVLGIPLALLHPWVVPLFGFPLLVYAALRAFREPGPLRASARALAPAVLLVTTATAFAMATRWTESDTGFADFFAKLGPLSPLAALDLPVPLLVVALTVVLGALGVAGALLVAAVSEAKARVPQKTRFAGAVVVGGLALASLPLLVRDLPPNVEYFSQLQPAAVILAIVGLALALVVPSRLGDLGLAITAFLLPLTAINIFSSEFWPQRTVVYLAIGVALLAAVAVSWAVGQAVRLVADGRSARFVAPVAVLAAVLLVGGAVAAKPAPTYPWYRLYDEAHFEAFELTAERLDDDEEARVIVYSWEPALMIRTLANPDQARYSKEFFQSGGARDKVLAEEPGETRYVLVDKVTLKKAKEGRADLSFLEDGRYQLVHSTEDGRFRLYEVAR